MAKPEREFSAVVGQKSMGTAGPEYLKKDFDKAFAMFDPNKNLPDGAAGGIGKENMQPGAVDDDVIGNREIDDTQAPTGNIGKYSNFLNGFAYMIKSITGKANWRTKPATTLDAAKTHIDAAAPHSGHETPAGAQAKVDTHEAKSAPHSGHETITGAQAKVDTHENKAAPHSGHETPAGAQAKVNTHEAKKNNPHAVSATQTGALVSVDGVSNPGGNIDLVAGAGVVITSDAVGKKITFAAKNDAIIPGAHAETHSSIGSDPITPASIGAETPAGAQSKVTTHENKTSTHGATATPTANRIAMYDSGKRLSSGAAPTSDNHVVRKIDMEAAKKHSLIRLAESIDYGGPTFAIAVDDDFVYVGGGVTKKIYKLNKSDLSKAGESIDYGGTIQAIAVDDDFVYVGGGVTKKIYKLNKSDLSKAGESIDYGGLSGTSIRAIAVDDDFVYAGGSTSQKVYKHNKSNLSKVAESADYGGNINAMAVDDNFVYIGGTTTKKVYKLNKSNLSKVAESIDYGGNILEIAVDDDFVYVGGDGTTTKKVYKLNKSDLSKAGESIDCDGAMFAIAIDDDFVYVGTAAKKIYKLNKSDLSKAGESTVYGGSVEAMVIDGDFVYVGGQIIQKVYKLLSLVSLK